MRCVEHCLVGFPFSQRYLALGEGVLLEIREYLYLKKVRQDHVHSLYT
jgi:hypothetical protein